MHPLSCPVKRLVQKKENASVLLKGMSFSSNDRVYEVILVFEIVSLSIFSRPLHTPSNQVAGETDIAELQRNPFQGLPKKLVLCCSGLTVEEMVCKIFIHTPFALHKSLDLKLKYHGWLGLQTVITEFAELSGVTISRKWEPNVTHVIASINENGACKRTLKFMMAILEGKWILSIDC